MHTDNLREAVHIARTTGFVSETLAKCVILKFGRTHSTDRICRLYDRMISALKSLALRHLLTTQILAAPAMSDERIQELLMFARRR